MIYGVKKLIAIVIIVAAAVGMTYLVKPRRSIAPTQHETHTENKPVIAADYVKYSGQDGKNAFELLQETANIEFKKYDFGVFVESIDGVKPDTKHFWKLYVNGKEAQVGADSIATKNGDTIEWKLEQINK